MPVTAIHSVFHLFVNMCKYVNISKTMQYEEMFETNAARW